jgi:hypothetical protein
MYIDFLKIYYKYILYAKKIKAISQIMLKNILCKKLK